MASELRFWGYGAWDSGQHLIATLNPKPLQDFGLGFRIGGSRFQVELVERRFGVWEEWPCSFLGPALLVRFRV